jgi:hypothetical protein
MIRAAIAIGLALLLSGCGALIPRTTKRTSAATESAAAKVGTSEAFERIVTGPAQQPQQAAPVRIGGMGNKVEVTMPAPPPSAVPLPTRSESFRYESQADAEDASDSTLDTLTNISIPAGVKLGLLAAGILAMLFALNRVRNASAAASAAFSAADGAMAQQIRRMRERAVVATDAATINALQAQIAELEAERGRLASGRH